MIPKKTVLFLIFIYLTHIAKCEEEFCTINGKRVLNKVSEKFLSITVDPVVLLSGLNLSDSSLHLAKHLAPAFIRLAGPSTPFVKYVVNDYENQPVENSSVVVITPATWFGVNEWIALTNLTPVFGINDAETSKDVWNPKTTLPLFELSDKLNVSCYWQLGFDCSNKSEIQYKQDLNILHHVLEAFPERKSWKIVASDLSECITQDHFEKARKTLQDIEGVVESAMWEPSTVNDFPSKKDLASKFTFLPNKPKVKLWTTVPRNTKPITFSAAILWAQQLGDAAKLGYNVVFRQPRFHELFTDTPVYWFSVLHKTLMGTVVLDTRKPSKLSGSYVYTQCSRKQNSFPRRGAITVMIVNNRSDTYTAMIRLGNPYVKTIEIQTYLLTSPNGNSTDTFLNDIKLTSEVLKDDKLNFLPKLRRAKAIKHMPLEVPAKSIAFFVLPGARLSVCVKYEETINEIIEEIGEDQQLPLSEEIALDLSSRGGAFNTLEELQENMRREFQSDENYYRMSKTDTPDNHLLKSRIIKNFDSIKKPQGKQIDSTRNFFIETAKRAEVLKKTNSLDDFDSKFQNLLGEISKLKESSDYDFPKSPLVMESSKVKTLELTSGEVDKILRERAQMKAAKKNVVFTSKELDELMSRASKKYSRMKKSIDKNRWEDFKTKVQEKKQEILSKTHLENLNNRISQQKEHILENKHIENVKSMLDNFKDKIKSQKQEFLNSPHMIKLKEEMNKFSSGNRIKRGVDYHKIWEDFVSKMEEKKEEILGNININQLKNKLEEEKDNFLKSLHINDLKNKFSPVDDWKSKLEEQKENAQYKLNNVISKLDDQREIFLSNPHLKKIREKMNKLNNARLRRDVGDNINKLKSKWEAKKQVLRSPFVIRNKLKQNILKNSHKRIKKDINMEMLKLKTEGQKAIKPKSKPQETLRVPKNPYALSQRSSEEFMSSSDEIRDSNFKFDINKVVHPHEKYGLSILDWFTLPKPEPSYPLAVPSHKLPTLPVLPHPNLGMDTNFMAHGKKKEHPCEKEIFGSGLSKKPTTFEELWSNNKNVERDKKLDDCMSYFNEKIVNKQDDFMSKLSEKSVNKQDDFISRLSDYLRDPKGMQEREDSIDLSLEEDTSPFFNFFKREIRTKRGTEITTEDINKYKIVMRQNLKDLREIIKQDRLKIAADTVKLRQESQKLQTANENENKSKRKEKLEKFKKLIEDKKTKPIIPRFGTVSEENVANINKLDKTTLALARKDNINKLRLKSELRQIEILKKQLERKQKLLAKLNMEETTTTTEHQMVTDETTVENIKASRIFTEPPTTTESFTLRSFNIHHTGKVGNILPSTPHIDADALVPSTTTEVPVLAEPLTVPVTEGISEENIHITTTERTSDNSTDQIVLAVNPNFKNKNLVINHSNNGKFNGKVRIENNVQGNKNRINKIKNVDLNKDDLNLVSENNTNSKKDTTTKLVKELENLENKVIEKMDKPDLIKRSVVINGKEFGNYRRQTDHMKKWKPDDILSLNTNYRLKNKESFKPFNDDYIFDRLKKEIVTNKIEKSKRSTDIDIRSLENEVDGFLDDEISNNKGESIISYENINNNIIKDTDDSYDGEDLNSIVKETELPILSFNDDVTGQFISYNDTMKFEPNTTKKKMIKQQSYDYIQKILPRHEQQTITKFFDNLKGLLQSIGKKLETSVKTLLG